MRAREGDIEEIARVVLDGMNAEKETPKRLSASAIAVMRRYGWPGNVRELRNALQQAFLMADDVIEPEHLPPEMNAGAPKRRGPLVEIRIGSSLAESENALIVATLDDVGGDKKRASEILGISLKTLYNKLKLQRAGADEPPGS